MAALIAYIVLSLCTTAATSVFVTGYRHCYVCHDIHNPEGCTAVHSCLHDEVCSTEMYHYGGHEMIWKFKCKNAKECINFSMTNLLGKRKRVEHGDLVCSHCCNDSVCQKEACSVAKYYGLTTAQLTASTTQFPTTASTTNALATTIVHATTVTEWPCLDFETSTVNCAQMKAAGYCRLRVEGIAYETAKLRCRKTCGFC